MDPAVSMDRLIAVVPLIQWTDLREYIGSVALKVPDKCIVPPQDEPHERVSTLKIVYTQHCDCRRLERQ